MKYSCILLFLVFVGSTHARDKYLKVENIYQCANSEHDAVAIGFAQGNTKFLKNKIQVNASVSVQKKVNGDLQVRHKVQPSEDE